MTRVPPSAVESLETHNLLTVSELVAREALGRRGSRGVCYRSDQRPLSDGHLQPSLIRR